MFVILKDAIRSMARHHIFEHIFGNITVTVELALLSFSFSDKFSFTFDVLKLLVGGSVSESSP